MAKNKKGGKKGGGKKDDDGGKKEKVKNERVVLDSRVRSLEKKYDEYQSLRVSLKEENGKFKNLYEFEVDAKEAITQHLQRELRKESEKCYTTKEDINASQAKHAPLKQKLKNEIENLQITFNSTKNTLTEEKNTIVGKLTLLEELRLQKDGYMLKLHQAEEKVAGEEKSLKALLRNDDKEHLLERARLNEDYVIMADKLFNEFDKVAADELSGMIRNALKKCVSVTQRLDKVSELGIQLQKHNAKLIEKKQNLQFELELDEAMDKQISAKIEKYHTMLNNLLKISKEQRRKLAKINKKPMETITKQVRKFKTEVIALQSHWYRMGSKKRKQEEYFKTTKELTENLKRRNLQLMSLMRHAEEIIRRELTSIPDENGLKNKLMEQFIILMNLPVTIESEEKSLLKSAKEELTASTQTSFETFKTNVENEQNSEEICAEAIETIILRCRMTKKLTESTEALLNAFKNKIENKRNAEKICAEIIETILRQCQISKEAKEELTINIQTSLTAFKNKIENDESTDDICDKIIEAIIRQCQMTKKVKEELTISIQTSLKAFKNKTEDEGDTEKICAKITENVIQQCPMTAEAKKELTNNIRPLLQTFKNKIMNEQNLEEISAEIIETIIRQCPNVE